MRVTAMALPLLLAACQAESQAPKPDLALITSLPVAFGESFGLEQRRSPLLARLEEDYTVLPVDGPEQLAPGGLLLAVQPQAMTAERLVALDKWVRDGGRLVLLADPFLVFESSRPLGDRFRPPLRYPDTGLLGHWGLTLDPQAGGEEAASTDLGRGIAVTGRLGTLTRAGGDCTLSPTRAAARCRIGKGYATIIADADFAVGEEPGDEGRGAVVALLGELER